MVPFTCMVGTLLTNLLKQIQKTSKWRKQVVSHRHIERPFFLQSSRLTYWSHRHFSLHLNKPKSAVHLSNQMKMTCLYLCMNDSQCCYGFATLFLLSNMYFGCLLIKYFHLNFRVLALPLRKDRYLVFMGCFHLPSIPKSCKCKG